MLSEATHCMECNVYEQIWVVYKLRHDLGGFGSRREFLTNYMISLSLENL